MPVNFMPSGADYLRLLPELILTVAGAIIMLLKRPWGARRSRNGLGYFSLVALAAAVVGSVIAFKNGGPAFSGLVIVDGYATSFLFLPLSVCCLCFPLCGAVPSLWRWSRSC